MSLHSLLADLRKIVEPNTPGTTRRFPTAEYLQGRQWVRRRMEEAGLEVSLDAAGNMFGRREGTEAGLLPIMVGSHSDTVYAGGHLDGALGVTVALEAARTLGPLRHPLVVVDYLAEEANDFGISCVGSRALAGTFQQAWLARPAHGTTLGQAIEQAGGRPEAIASAQLPPGSLHAALELHIEQGPVLESSDISLAVVSGIVGITRGTFVLRGQADHAGTAPMGLRRDALAAAAQLVLLVEDICRSTEGAVGTVGRLEVEPNQSNVVPDKVTMIAEVRHLEEAALAQLWEDFQQRAAEICGKRGIGFEMVSLTRTPPARPPQWLLEAVLDACREVDPKTLVLQSGAGHDTGHICAQGAIMLFVPSIGGRSHCPEEDTHPHHLDAGLEAIKASILALDILERPERCDEAAR